MQRVKDAALKLKLYSKLQLGEKRAGENGKESVHSTGPHTVKITAEPTTTIINKNGKSVNGFKFIVEENGQLYKWLVPLTNEQGEGHYLIERLQNIEVGQEIVLEMKKRGPKNYIDISRPGEEEDEIEVPPDEREEIDPTKIPF